MLAQVCVLLAILLITCVASQSDYTHYPGLGYYKFHGVNSTWEDAWVTCYNEDAKLVVINSAEEQKLISEIIQQNGHPVWTFIGFHSLFKKNSTIFVSVDGEKLDNLPYMQWKPGDPDNLGGVQFCGAVDIDAMIDDATCEKLFPFICEIS